jgi:hypothetical protein
MVQVNQEKGPQGGLGNKVHIHQDAGAAPDCKARSPKAVV